MQVKSDHSSRWHRLHISPPRSRIIVPLSSTSTTAHRRPPLCPGVITPAGARLELPTPALSHGVFGNAPGGARWRPPRQPRRNRHLPRRRRRRLQWPARQSRRGRVPQPAAAVGRGQASTVRRGRRRRRRQRQSAIGAAAVGGAGGASWGARPTSHGPIPAVSGRCGRRCRAAGRGCAGRRARRAARGGLLA